MSFAAIETHNVLAIYRGGSQATVSQEFLKGLQRYSDEHPGQVNIFNEYLDVPRLRGKHDYDIWVDYFNHKYRNIAIHSIIADNADSSRFIVNAPAKHFFPGVNKFVQQVTAPDLVSDIFTIKKDLTFMAVSTLNMAIRHNPNLSKIVLVGSSSSVNSHLLEAITENINIHHDIQIETILNEALTDIKHKISMLSGNVAVFYSPVFSDQQGNRYVPLNVATELSQISQVPIYSFWSVFAGSGVLGGYMEQPEKLAYAIIEQAHKVNADSLRTFQLKTATALVDVSLLSKYSIDENRLTPHTIRFNEPLPFWIAHQEFFKTALVCLALLLVVTVYYNKSLRGLNAKLETSRKKAETLARTDPLTSIPNRRAFFEQSELALSLARRHKNSVAVIIFDIDNFKHINDTYGHAMGDEVIKAVANMIEENKRNHDIAARIGGEEFALFVPLADLEMALILAGRIRETCEHYEFKYKAQRIVVTLSAGIHVSVSLQREDTVDNLLHRADLALYQAKLQGKNRVVTYNQ